MRFRRVTSNIGVEKLGEVHYHVIEATQGTTIADFTIRDEIIDLRLLFHEVPDRTGALMQPSNPFLSVILSIILYQADAIACRSGVMKDIGFTDDLFNGVGRRAQKIRTMSSSKVTLILRRSTGELSVAQDSSSRILERFDEYGEGQGIRKRDSCGYARRLFRMERLTPAVEEPRTLPNIIVAVSRSKQQSAKGHNDRPSVSHRKAAAKRDAFKR